MSRPKTPLEEQVDNVVRDLFSRQETAPSEQEVRAQYELIFDSLGTVLSNGSRSREESIDDLVANYCAQLPIKKNLGFAYVKDHKPWLGAAESRIEEEGGWVYWRRYKQYLVRNKKWTPASVRCVEKDTFRILDYMADPKSSYSFERRGLVVASVQSGKTANYIGLISRAADVGYKLIIVMAGVHNVLRNQTQVRLEEGFTGFNIANQKREPVGVGLLDTSSQPIALTSRTADFNKGRANALRTLQTTHINAPFLFVIKKNSNSLKQVYEWLQDNADHNDPLLLIDDEADNASINGKYKREHRDDEPTRINGQIRNILRFFDRKCYVGYTATPFANILIDPEVDTSDHGPDLFPSSFIYTLEDSSDYFGATKVFADYDKPNPKYLRIIDDIDAILPPSHKSYDSLWKLPESLKTAIRTFLIATAIRGLRGDGDEHSTMMVNVSPYRAPQKSAADAIRDYLEELKNAIFAYGAYEPGGAREYSTEMRDLHATWLSEYADNPTFSWREIQAALYAAVKDMHVACINTSSNDMLEYDLHTEHVIAVGGYRLSRGLTLEGLVVSYYSRNAKAYDALMQMARWFGYRFGYEDLCRIWMSEKSMEWYDFVTESTDDLFDELREMRQVRSTPRDYGLRIKQCPDSLVVTARNKMGTGTRMKSSISLNKEFVETVAFERDPEIVAANKTAVEALLESVAGHQDFERFASTGEYFYRNVSVEPIIRFIKSYRNEDGLSPRSQCRPILSYIDDRIIDGELESWDVFVAHGEGDLVRLSSKVSVRREIRFPGSSTEKERVVVGDKHRLASRGIEKEGLTPAEARQAEQKCRETRGKDANISDIYYRQMRKRPLLVIHPVLMKYSDEKIRRLRETGGLSPLPETIWRSLNHSEEAYGWSISFPYTSKQTRPVEYVFNQVAIDNMNSQFNEDSDDDEADE